MCMKSFWVARTMAAGWAAGNMARASRSKPKDYFNRRHRSLVANKAAV